MPSARTWPGRSLRGRAEDHHDASRHRHHARGARTELPARDEIQHRAERRRHGGLALSPGKDHHQLRDRQGDHGHPELRRHRQVPPHRARGPAGPAGPARREDHGPRVQFPDRQASPRRDQDLRRGPEEGPVQTAAGRRRPRALDHARTWCTSWGCRSTSGSSASRTSS